MAEIARLAPEIDKSLICQHISRSLLRRSNVVSELPTSRRLARHVRRVWDEETDAYESRKAHHRGGAGLASSLDLVVQPITTTTVVTIATSNLDAKLTRVLREHRFSGRIESELEDRLGRRVDQDLANLGRLLWFDNSHSLHRDNTCAGCHSPSNGIGDTQSIAIGVDNNGLVGPEPAGAAQSASNAEVINTAFYPKLMWNGRFFANALDPNGLGDPFRNNFGFTFPSPEGRHAELPRSPAAGAGVHSADRDGRGRGLYWHRVRSVDSPFDIFDDGHGLPLPAPDGSGFRNEPIRQKVMRDSERDARIQAGVRQGVSLTVAQRRADYHSITSRGRSPSSSSRSSLPTRRSTSSRAAARTR